VTSESALPAPVVAEARAVLSVRARSFRWGAFFLPAAVSDDAAIVYAFCRLADDLADDAPDALTAAAALASLRSELLGGDAPRPVVAAFLDVVRRKGPGLAPALDLLHGVEGDLHEVRMPDDEALLRYCYEVAGTVGLMMSSVLGAVAPSAREPALALGRAMQLTNICRDVAEDAGLGRVYLPRDRLAAIGLAPEDVLTRRPSVAPVLVDLLALADVHYRFAEEGMRHIPARSRLAIRVASRLYQGIGGEIGRRGHDAWSGRAVVPPWRKLGLVARALVGAR